MPCVSRHDHHVVAHCPFVKYCATQGNPTGTQWQVFLTDQNIYNMETCKEYVKNAIFNKWSNGTWTIKDYPNTGVEGVASAESKIEKPKFKVAAIKEGQLVIPQTTLEVHACGSVTALAKLTALVKVSDARYHVPAFTIGGTNTKPAKKIKTTPAPAATTTEDIKLVKIVVCLTFSECSTHV